MSAPRSSSLLAARCLLGELERGGLRQACLAPGSRSTPLALALAERPAIRTHVITDERSLAFFALGMARASAAPVLLVCTSGTAAANFLPAVVEASLTGAPLLVLTADRPPELRDCAAPQTIDQPAIYGSHVRWAADVAILDVGERAERYYRATARRALASACAEHAGPVHLNLPFREPFWDESFDGKSAAAGAGDGYAPRAAAATPAHAEGDGTLRLSDGDSRCAEDAQPRPGVVRSASRLEASQTRAIAVRLARAERGLIVCAGHALPSTEIAALAAALGWPILADPLSGLRYGDHDRTLVVDAYDALLRDEGFRREQRPDVILRFGTTPAPRSLQTFLEESWPCDHLLVAASGWPDPFHACSSVLRSAPALLCGDLVAMLGPGGVRGQWTQRWLGASSAARAALEAGLDAAAQDAAGVFEGGVVRAVARALGAVFPQQATLFVGNSMPIRDADAFFGQSDANLSVLANRGASGIDGVLSTALGVAATRRQPTVLIVGDLSFLHDITALALAARYRIPLVTVVINNNGGGIFSFLPQRDLEGVFEPLFATPHDVDLASTAAALLPGGYALATDTDHLAELVRPALDAAEPRVIELRCNRTTTPERNRGLIAAAQAAACDGAAQAAACDGAAQAAACDGAAQAAASKRTAQAAACDGTAHEEGA